MATKQNPLGALDKEVQAKMAAKWNQEKADEARAWVEALSGKSFSGTDKDAWVASLKDGELLCIVINKIKEGSAKYKASTMAFGQRENITQYLEGCRKLGMKDVDLFVTQDLFEGDNLVQVVDQLHSLGAVSKTIDGFSGPYIGVKYSHENKRTFSPEVLAQSAMAVPLQNAGSIAVEKERGTDHIVRYGLSADPLTADQMRAGSAVIPLQNAGSIQVTKENKTDSIVRYGTSGDPVSAEQLRAGSAEIPKANQGANDVDKQRGQDSLTRALHS